MTPFISPFSKTHPLLFIPSSWAAYLQSCIAFSQLHSKSSWVTLFKWITLISSNQLLVTPPPALTPLFTITTSLPIMPLSSVQPLCMHEITSSDDTLYAHNASTVLTMAPEHYSPSFIKGNASSVCSHPAWILCEFLTFPSKIKQFTPLINTSSQLPLLRYPLSHPSLSYTTSCNYIMYS